MYWIKWNVFTEIIIISSCLLQSFAIDLKGFDDTTLFKINWPGRDHGELLLDVPEGSESMIVTSHKNEKYKCMIPNVQEKTKNSDVFYDGPNALEVLAPLFSHSSCSFRLESYWTYEVCHGRYVRQYHEDREAKGKIQEFILGRWDKALLDQLSKELDSGMHAPPPVKKLDGLSLPYLQINLTDGTLCDLNGKPRKTSILYVCYNLGKHEVYSFKETSTCEYEVVVLSALLCEHPMYKPKESGENQIHCLPLEGSPKKPRSLLQMEAESLKLRHQRILDDDVKILKVYAAFSIDKVQGEDGETQTKVHLELKQIDTQKIESSTAAPQIEDTSLVENFLSGKNCLQGGSGWWKYEFCYGKHVDQYHEEKDGSKTVVRLGTFDKETHLQWLKKNPHKKLKPTANRITASHFYGGGSMCDLTGQPRETEVKLKCVEGQSKSFVSLYLLEPQTCQYILGVESPIICKILHKLDDTGLMPIEDPAALEDDGVVMADIED